MSKRVIRTLPHIDFGSPRELKMSPDGSHGWTKSVQMEPIWIHGNAKNAQVFSLYLKPWASINCPGLIIRRPSSRPKLTLIFHVATSDPHPPLHRFWVPRGSPKWVQMGPMDGQTASKWNQYEEMEMFKIQRFHYIWSLGLPQIAQVWLFGGQVVVPS